MKKPLCVEVGPKNGRADRLVVYTLDGMEYRDELRTDNGFSRQKSIERAADAFGLDRADLRHLDGEIVRLADEEDDRTARPTKGAASVEARVNVQTIGGHPMTDWGNARRLVDEHGKDFR